MSHIYPRFAAVYHDGNLIFPAGLTRAAGGNVCGQRRVARRVARRGSRKHILVPLLPSPAAQPSPYQYQCMPMPVSVQHHHAFSHELLSPGKGWRRGWRRASSRSSARHRVALHFIALRRGASASVYSQRTALLTLRKPLAQTFYIEKKFDILKLRTGKTR